LVPHKTGACKTVVYQEERIFQYIVEAVNHVSFM